MLREWWIQNTPSRSKSRWKMLQIDSFPVFLALLQCASTQDLTNPHLAYQRIQIETQSRDYRSGPVGGLFTVSTHDQMLMTVEYPGEEYIWKWAMYSEETNAWCDQTRIYDRGNQSAMICMTSGGIYNAYAKKVAVLSLPQSQQRILKRHFESPMVPLICNEGDACFKVFQIVSRELVDRGETQNATQEIKGADILKSEPLFLKQTEYCFVWAYNLQEEERVNYIDTEPQPMGSDTSYILYRLRMWITEANAMNEKELIHDFDQSDYSAVITRRFQSKGLSPCLRFAHKSIELVTVEPTYTNEGSEKLYWTIDFKVHTDTIIATLSDITFTITSRQHIALYGCFVGETRGMINSREFRFLQPQRNELQIVNLAGSNMPMVQFIGRPWNYEAAEHRKDVQIFQNPCLTLELLLAVRGVSYMAQTWLSYGEDDLEQITVPGLQNDDRDLGVPGKEENVERASQEYIKAYDFSFTPTHLVILTENSHLFLHPTSITFKGFGFIRDTQNFKIGALVSRRWCAQTGTSKEHNMIIPAFSAGGNFIVIQIIPTEETTTMWLQSPTGACLKPRLKTEKDKNREKDKATKQKSKESDKDQKMAENLQVEYLKRKLEICIHRHEIPKFKTKLDSDTLDEEVSDEECELLTGQPISGKKEDAPKNSDQLLKFWKSGATFIGENDAHFPENEEDPSLLKTDSTSGNFNRHILYEVDKRGTHIINTFNRSGIELESRKTQSNTQYYFWLHDVQFTAVERRFMLAVEIKSPQIKRTSFVMAMMVAVSRDMPVRIMEVKEKVELESSYDFSGVLIVRPMDFSAKHDEDHENEDSSDIKRLDGGISTYTTNTAILCYVMHIDYRKDDGDSQDVLIYATLDGTHARPLRYYSEPPTKENPNGKVRVRFADQHPKLTDDKMQGVLKIDMIMTEYGSISVLMRKANLSSSDENDVEPQDFYPQGLIIGSVMTPEPLRKVTPFKGSSYIFQRTTADGEIVYGTYSLENWNSDSSEVTSDTDKNTETTTELTAAQNITESPNTVMTQSTTQSVPTTGNVTEQTMITINDTISTIPNSNESESVTETLNKDVDPSNTDDDDDDGDEDDSVNKDFQPTLVDVYKTRFLATPYESLLVGSIGASVLEKKEVFGSKTDATTVLGENCPFSEFVVHHIPFDFAEVEYRTRITAELTFLGSAIPLEADIIVEYRRIPGVSVEIHSSIEEMRDQTLVRKTIDIYTFLTPTKLSDMYEYPDYHDDKEEIKEDTTIFSITIRPSIVNLNCHKSLFFKTIQINVGCNPFTSMRFIAEALGLKKIKILRTDNYEDRENEWTIFQNGDDVQVTVPRAKTNFGQTSLFKCVNNNNNEKRGYCTIPKKYSKLFKENMYNIHFTKWIVPKFEQFLTRHVRKVTGNVFLYNVLPGKLNMEPNTTLLDAKCHNMGSNCAPMDLSCGDFTDRETIRQKSPWTEYFNEQRSKYNLHTDIYRHYRDCYASYRTTKTLEKIQMERVLPSSSQLERYWIFNSTNYNAFKMEKHRNMIFLIRAVVLNTADNSFTYCQRLETFFLLQLIGVAPARQPLPWQFYLALIAFVLFVFVLVYFYFARSPYWQSDLTARRVREQEDKEQREIEAKQFKQEQMAEPINQWARKLQKNAQYVEPVVEPDPEKLETADIPSRKNTDTSNF